MNFKSWKMLMIMLIIIYPLVPLIPSEPIKSESCPDCIKLKQRIVRAELDNKVSKGALLIVIDGFLPDCYVVCHSKNCWISCHERRPG